MALTKVAWAPVSTQGSEAEPDDSQHPVVRGAKTGDLPPQWVGL